MTANAEQFLDKIARLDDTTHYRFTGSSKVYVQGSRSDLLVPMREPHGTQTLLRMSKSNDGVMLQRVILAVRFVPFTGPGING